MYCDVKDIYLYLLLRLIYSVAVIFRRLMLSFVYGVYFSNSSCVLVTTKIF